MTDCKSLFAAPLCEFFRGPAASSRLRWRILSTLSRSLPLRCPSLCVFWGSRSDAGGRLFVSALEGPVDLLVFSVHLLHFPVCFLWD